MLLRALGFVGDREILDLFYERETIDVKGKRVESALGRVCAQDLADDATGEILLEANDELTAEKIEVVKRSGLATLEVYVIPKQDEADLIRNTLRKDPTRSQEDALHRIYNLLRPGEPPRRFRARSEQAVLQPALRPGAVGRQAEPNDALRPRRRSARPGAGLRHSSAPKTSSSSNTWSCCTGDEEMGEPAQTDDIDHLGNRRVRSVGELLANQFNIGLTRMARIIRERMSLQDSEQVTPYDLINARTISAVIQSFFGSSQLSQFMDQTNPLAELTHKRRLSALGPGGLTRDRAGFEVRDVHYTHYGRMCPIETPEGPNIGLISSLSTYARVNDMGFLETPYFRVSDGVVDRKKPEFLAADIEDAPDRAGQHAVRRRRGTRRSDAHRAAPGRIPHRADADVEYMDVSPIQLVSPAAALIPFLEHDDANRALMGSNMQRQAVPLLITEAPLVGTGLSEQGRRGFGRARLARPASWSSSRAR